MALIACHECGKTISDQAASCPACGAPVRAASSVAVPAGARAATSREQQTGYMVLGALVLGGVWMCSERSPSRPTENGPPTTRAGYVGCLTLEALARTRELSGDAVALSRYVADPANGCVELAADQVVAIDRVGSSGTKIRLPGDTASVWVPAAAIIAAPR